MIDFFQYLSAISKFHINGKFIGQDPANVMATFLEVTRPKDYKIDISYTNCSSEEPGYYPFMQLYTCSPSIKDPPIVPEDNCNKLEVKYRLDVVNFTWPHTPIIEKYGSKLKELTFGAGSERFVDLTKDSERTYNDGVYNCLNRILEKCTSLEHFKLEDIDLSNRQLKKSSTNTSITTLEIFTSTILFGILHGLSRRLPSLKRLILFETEIRIGMFGQEMCALNIDMTKSELDNITWKKFGYELDSMDEPKFFLHVCKTTKVSGRNTSDEEGDGDDEEVENFILYAKRVK